jgi:Asp-tRNAAsn/Glu-tRNAGln amidotransferase A subunit and related amidases
MITVTYPVVSPAPVPDGLLAAFEAYETALLANDVTTLDALFAPGPDTVRGDGTALLVGHDAITRFRTARTVIPTRRVAELHVRPLGEDAALLMASTVEPSNGATGLQTQLWQRFPDGWKVTAAHVSLPTKQAAAQPVVDPAVWRVVGTPLVPPTGSGLLDGVTVAVKDLFAVAGQPIGAGNPTWLAEQQAQPATAPAVAALLAAGAEITGIARTDEFAYSLAGQNAHYGSAPNPAVPGGIGGGSTSGPAAAVALDHVVVGLGTDTAGSIRVPASYQGLVGIRTTHDAVPRDGLVPLAPSFDTVGWLARTTGPVQRVAEVLLPGATGGAPKRTAVLPTAEGHASPDVATACTDRRAALVADGLLPAAEPADLAPETVETWFAAFRTLQAFEAWAAHGEWITAHPGALGADVAARFAAAAEVTPTQADDARGTVAEARTWLRELLADAVLVLPSSAGGAPARDASAETIEAERAGTLRMSCLAGLAGAPAVSLPVLRTADGRPAGLCLVGAPGTDLDLLNLAHAIEGSTA